MIFHKKIPSETWTHPPTSIVFSDFWKQFLCTAPKTKGNKEFDTDMIPIEVWTNMGRRGLVFLENEMYEVLTITSDIPSS